MFIFKPKKALCLQYQQFCIFTNTRNKIMISEKTQKQITDIWDNYLKANKIVIDSKGNAYENIDDSRLKAIQEIKVIVNTFLSGKSNVYEFKTTLDSYNKRNNLWGFTATKGQMFFNQLTKTNDQNIEKVTSLLKEVIKEPINLKDALNKLDALEKFADNIFSQAKDKRKAPNPGSVGYFLSYFWQIHNHQKWPIIYTSILNAYTDLGIWISQKSQKEYYEYFYNLNEDIKSIIKKYTKKDITNWDAEHAFWNYSGKPIVVFKKVKEENFTMSPNIVEEIKIKANFDISDYLIPKVAKLIELGNEPEKSASAKGSQYERLVSEIFKQLDFDVEVHGQGSGRNPDAIIKFREENTAFIVDAKAYSNGYILGTDDRAIKEYINNHSPKLIKDGYKKIGFIIVSNSFKPNFDSFINEITWTTDIKRFVLLTSEALLYLLAYKTKDKLKLASIIESIVSFSNPVTAQNVIEEFDDI